jgi:hypothetical protein
MADGWRGVVEQDTGDTIVCIEDGHRPNDYLDGYRAVSRRLVAVKGGIARCAWKTDDRESSVFGKPSRRDGAAERARPSAAEPRRPSAAELRRAKLAAEWDALHG